MSKRKSDCYIPIQNYECKECCPPLNLIDNIRLIVRHAVHDGGDECATINIKGLVSSKVVDKIVAAFQCETEEGMGGYEFQLTYTCPNWADREHDED